MSKQDAEKKGPQAVPENAPQAPAEKMLVVPEILVNEILGYLAGRPYVEVHQLIQGIQGRAQHANVIPLTQEK